MTRVWLQGWEWGCCGEPFAVGDAVDLGIRSRGLDSWLAEHVGAELAASVDALESHHEEEFPIAQTHRVARRGAREHPGRARIPPVTRARGPRGRSR